MKGPVLVYVLFPVALAFAPMPPEGRAARVAPHTVAPATNAPAPVLTPRPTAALIQGAPRSSALARFPQSLAEAGAAPRAIALPARRRDVHLRALAVVAARFGQVTELKPDGFELLAFETNALPFHRYSGVIVGLRSELAAVLPADWGLPRTWLGRGVLAQFTCATNRRPCRWLIVSGEDDAGLEKAVLTLGHAEALAQLGASPATIVEAPTLDADTGPLFEKISNLEQLPRLLARDQFLRHAAILVPERASPAELRTMWIAAWQAGRATRGSTVAWPEAFAYSSDAEPPRGRLMHCSALVLGSVAQWTAALGDEVSLAVRGSSTDAGALRIQGRAHALDEFEPDLALLQLCPSPWSCSEALVVAGGWRDFSGRAIEQALGGSESNALGGNLAALDLRGRSARYEVGKASLQSFAEVLKERIPRGLSLTETRVRLATGDARTARVSKSNKITMLCCAAVLFLVVAGRIWFQQERWRGGPASRPVVSEA